MKAAIDADDVRSPIQGYFGCQCAVVRSNAESLDKSQGHSSYTTATTHKVPATAGHSNLNSKSVQNAYEKIAICTTFASCEAGLALEKLQQVHRSVHTAVAEFLAAVYNFHASWNNLHLHNLMERTTGTCDLEVPYIC